MISLRTWICATVIGLALFASAGAAIVYALPPLSVAKAEQTSPLVLAEDGRVLRVYLAADTRWRLPTTVSDVPRHYLDILIGFEDRRYYEHQGVDLRALARAVWQLVSEGRRTSGASTLTMQVARLLEPRRRGLKGKLIQIVRALQLERRYSKRQILDLYLTLAPFGSNIEGVRAASLAYFGKEPGKLEPAQSALLVAISQRPERRRPDRHKGAALKARNYVLNRALSVGAVPASFSKALDEPIVIKGRRFPILAAHLADRLRQGRNRSDVVYTEVDFGLQEQLEQIARRSLAKWPAEMNTAILVIRNRDCAVRAYVGAADFLPSDGAGQFDHVRGVRSPGSALKPLIYGLAFEDLLVHPLTLTTDAPVAFDGYAPRNFGEGYQGQMTIREALIKSINTTAVSVLSQLGPARLTTRLRSAGIPIRMSGTDMSAGLAIGLGGAGTSLESLSRLYAGIARDGVMCNLDVSQRARDTDDQRLLSAEAAWALADILADVPPPAGYSVRRAKDGGRRIAYKTGTSYGFRDAWAIGFDEKHTVGVWTGRSDGAPTLGATGVGSAAPLMFRAFDLLPNADRDVAARRPSDSVLARHGELPYRLQRLRASPGTSAGDELRILFPRADATLAVMGEAGSEKSVPLVATGGVPPYFWSVDGNALDADASQTRWQPNGPGQVTVTIMDSSGEQSKVAFWVK